MLIDRLYEEVQQKSPVCVGLDTKEGYLPQYLQQKEWPLWEKIFFFNRSIIEATEDLCACYKVQIACYEALGLEGLKAYQKTLSYLRAQGKIIIADVKRGDISATAQMYGQAHFEGDFEADFITVNPYMGIDAVAPYFDYVKNKDKGLFILCKTSNQSAKDFQELDCEGRPLYLHVAQKIEAWGQDFLGRCGYSALGAVVGLTYPEEFQAIRHRHQRLFYLIPGYGAQGGRGQDLAPVLSEDKCCVVNSSRGLIAFHKGKEETEKFVDVVRNQTQIMKEDILKWLK